MLHVTKAITIMQPADTVYRYWRDFSNLPQLHGARAERRDDRRSAFALGRVGPGRSDRRVGRRDRRGRAGRTDRLAIARRRRHSPRRLGRFEPAPGGRGTEVHVDASLRRAGGTAGAAIAKLLRRRARPADRRRPAPLQAGDGNRRGRPLRRQPEARGQGVLEAAPPAGARATEVRR